MKNKKISFIKNKLIYNAVSSVIIIVFIICLVLVNVLATFLSERFTALSIDMTSSSDYTISEKNKEYIKKIDEEVEIILTCTEDYYLSEYIATVGQYYSDASGGKYFKQTIELLKNYKKINSNIKVKFIDATTPEFGEYKEKYEGSDISIGDIIVDYTYSDEDGLEKTKYKVLTLDDLYTIGQASEYTYDDSVYGVISGSSVETAVTSALYYVTKIQDDIIAVVTGYGCVDVSSYVDSLKINGYDHVEISNLTFDEIPEEATMLLLPAPVLDLSESEVKKIDEFLLGKSGDSDFDYNKSLIYFGSNSQTDLPNVDGLLEEWGIKYSDGTVYENNANNHASSSNTVILLNDAESEFTKGMNENLSFVCDNLRPMNLKFETSGKFNTYEVVKSSDSCVIKPYENVSNWNPDAENQASYSSVVLSRYVTENPNKNNEPRFSNVLSVASIDFISDTYTSGSYLGNDELILSLLNTCANRVEETYEIENKEIDYSVFTPTEAQANTIFVICVIIVPILTIVFGVVLFIIRKRK